MKSTPICVIVSRLKPFPPQHKQAHVAALIKAERQANGRTKRLAELEALAFSICFPQVKKVARDEKRRLHS